jgi:hypothetical protein
MTSSDCLSSNNLHPRLSTKSHLNLPVPTILDGNDELKRSSSCISTPTSTSPNNFFTPTTGIQPRFPQPNMFAFPRHPPPAPTLSRRNVEFKPPEQDVLDKNFFRTFNMEQKDDKKSENATHRSNRIFYLEIYINHFNIRFNSES